MASTILARTREAAVLVVRNQKQRALPTGAGAQRLIDLLEEALALAHTRLGVLPRWQVTIGLHRHARLQPGELLQRAAGGVGKELVQVVHVLHVLGAVHVGEIANRPQVVLVQEMMMSCV